MEGPIHLDYYHSHIFKTFVSSFPYLQDLHHSHIVKSFIIPIFSRLLFHHLIMNFSVSSHPPDIRSSWFKTQTIFGSKHTILSNVRFIWIGRQFSVQKTQCYQMSGFAKMVSNVWICRHVKSNVCFIGICRQWFSFSWSAINRRVRLIFEPAKRNKYFAVISFSKFLSFHDNIQQS